MTAIMACVCVYACLYVCIFVHVYGFVRMRNFFNYMHLHMSACAYVCVSARKKSTRVFLQR